MVPGFSSSRAVDLRIDTYDAAMRSGAAPKGKHGDHVVDVSDMSGALSLPWLAGSTGRVDPVQLAIGTVGVTV